MAVSDICTALDVPLRTLQKWVRQSGAPRPHKMRFATEVKELYDAGWEIRDIAYAVGVDVKTVHNYRNAMGWPGRTARTGRVYRSDQDVLRMLKAGASHHAIMDELGMTSYQVSQAKQRLKWSQWKREVEATSVRPFKRAKIALGRLEADVRGYQ
jgi:uncharacterized protein YjcR